MEDEFGGAHGALFMTVGLPLTTFCLFSSAEKGALDTRQWFRNHHPENLFSGFIIYSLWFAFQLYLDRSLSGELIEWSVRGVRLQYCMNGLKAWLVTHIAVAAGLIIMFNESGEDGSSPMLHWLVSSKTMYGVMVSSMLYSVMIALLSFIYPKLKISSSESNNPLNQQFSTLNKKSSLSDIMLETVYEFWMGASLSPLREMRYHRDLNNEMNDSFSSMSCEGTFDLKLFCEARPGLQLWVLIDFLLCLDLWVNYDGMLDPGMILCFVMQYCYIWDYFVFESAILSTLDLMHDNFGFMLAFGDLTWVPFVYSLQCWTLYNGHLREMETRINNQDPSMHLGWVHLLCVIGFVLGYIIFRQSNLQKHRFRSGMLAQFDPAFESSMESTVIRTSRNGGGLLVYGWWAYLRKANYSGDWLMSVMQSSVAIMGSSLRWSAMPSRFGWILVAFYPLYFAVLLVHREQRDHRRCQRKYGRFWDLYCRRVPFRFIPFVY